MKSKHSQNAQILRHLKSGSITQLSAWIEYGCFRLPSRIWDLKTGVHDGKRWPIKSKMIYDNGKHYARYSLPRCAGYTAIEESVVTIEQLLSGKDYGIHDKSL